MSEERIRQLSRRNLELAEKVTQLELLKNHWYQELVGVRRELEELQAKVEAMETERLERIATESVGDAPEAARRVVRE